MKKLTLVLAVAALALAACGGAGQVAATVDGFEITVGDVEGLIHAEGSTISKDTFAQYLGFEIARQIMVAAVEAEYGIEISDSEMDAEADRIYQEGKLEGETKEAFVNSRGVTEAFLMNFAQQRLISEQVLELLAADFPRPPQDQIDDQMAAAGWELTVVCAAHILVETEEDAQAVLAEVQDGRDFAEVAVEKSTGPSGPNGGDLGCQSPAEYVPEFRDATLAAPVGAVYEEIVQSFFGFHVILVTERTDPNPEDLPSEDEVVELMNLNAANSVFEPWFVEQLLAADVVVDENYGTWDPTPPGQVIPPTG